MAPTSTSPKASGAGPASPSDSGSSTPHDSGSSTPHAGLTTTVTELPESRVRVDVQVSSGEVERQVELKARELGRKLKLPGFRRGKVPPQLVLQRLGREAVLEEAVRDGLANWYADALTASGIAPVGDPQLDLGELPPAGAELRFTIEIGVLPRARLGAYEGLEVGRGEPQVQEPRVEEEVARLRDRLAKLESVERAAERGDFLVIDYRGVLSAAGGEGESKGEGEGGGEGGAGAGGEPFPGGEGRDQLVELGSGSLIPGFEEALVGAAAGEQREVAVTFPADYGHEPLAGRPASFAVTVKDVKRKQLPELDEDFAIDVGFDTVQELREDIRGRLREAEERRLEGEFRQAALDAAVANATIEVPPALVQARAQEMWERMLHSLAHRGVSKEAYLQIDGRSEADILAELQPDAEQALRREAVLAAIVASEHIEPSEEQLLDAVRPTAEREQLAPEELFEKLRQSGRLEELREDLAARQAMDLIAQRAKPIPLEQAKAREKLWTPEKADDGPAAAGPGGLWTPDR